MPELTEGKSAPSFSLPSTNGKKISLKELAGKKVVLYFYPKDDTPGCTQEACDFRDSIKQFQKQGATVLGVSPDPIKKHDKFREKYKLPFTLLSDESKEMLQKYGVWKEKSMYGRKYMGVERTTVILDKEGKIRKIFPKVKVTEHAKEVLKAVQEIG